MKKTDEEKGRKAGRKGGEKEKAASKNMEGRKR